MCAYHSPPPPCVQALEEPSFSIAYANLCKVLSPLKVEYEDQDGKIKQTNFRRELLTKCQVGVVYDVGGCGLGYVGYKILCVVW